MMSEEGSAASEAKSAGTPAEDVQHQTSPAEIVEGAKAWSQVAKSFLYVEVSSLILMFSCIGFWGKVGATIEPYLSYALSVSVVSLAACLIIQTGEFVKPGLLEKFEKQVSLFLFVWWAVGTGVMTFKAPFTVLANGYFAAWAGLFFTTHWALNIDTSKFTELDKCRKAIVSLGLAAAIVMFACIPYLIDGSYVGGAAWGLSAGVITIAACFVLLKMYDDINAKLFQVSSVIIFIVWTVVAGVLTFDGPFLLAGNGYFGCWAGFLASFFLLNHAMTREDEIV